MVRRSTVVKALLVASLSGVGLAQAQTPGQIPQYIDASGTLGDSTIAQDASGNISLTNATGNPVLAVSNTSGDPNSHGVFGQSLNGNGVFGQTSNAASSGIYGENQNNSNGYGVAGRAFGSSGIGVLGESGGAGSGTGVYGTSSNGTGVFGVSTNSAGVYGFSPNGYAVYAQSTNSYAGFFQGRVVIATLGLAGSSTLCRNTSNEIAACSSSLRYKTDVRPFRGGLDIVSRLRPIAFTWKQGGMADIGLGAEDVEQVEPLLTFRNDQGEIEGVKYNQLTAVFVNAIRDQQTQIEHQKGQIEHQNEQIERQQSQLTQQQGELAGLKALLCASHAEADVCR